MDGLMPIIEIQGQLENEFIRIVPLEEKHLEGLLKIRNEKSTRDNLTNPNIFVLEQSKKWFSGLKNDGSKLYLAIENSNDELLGYIRCDEWDKLNNSIRFGCDIASEHRNKGLATQSCNLVLHYFFEKLNLNRVWLLVLASNTIGIKLDKRLGLKIEGVQRQAIFRNGTYHDYVMMSILKSEFYKIRKKSKRSQER
ncbi:MAG: GNAT family N-acetyltransferase [Geobacter sp.]|nr:GNAT family N-acetyltransferase [Geobacter sp.]